MKPPTCTDAVVSAASPPGQAETAAATQAELDSAVALIRESYSGLVGLLHRKLKDRELAADLVNEAVAIALEHARSGRMADTQRIAGYVFKTSMNLLRNHARNMDNRQELRADAERLATGAPTVEHEVDRQRLTQLVEELLEELRSDRDRDIVKRFYLDEEDKEVVCTQLSISADYFDKVVFRARQRMKNLLQARGVSRGDYFGALLL